MLRCYARRFLSNDSFADFAEDFVKIQSFQVINFDDYGLFLRASCYGKIRCEYQCKCGFTARN